jgi:hypothetical protein
MEIIINDCIPFNDCICDYIINHIEDAKDYVMIFDKKITNKSKTLYRNNPSLQSFGLSPTSESDTLKNITERMLGTSVSSISKLSRVATDNKICIVIINHVIKTPIEFTIWKLIDYNLAQPYFQNADMGITQKTIDKFDIASFKPIDKGKKWDFGVVSYGNIKSDTFIILENLNHDLFRVYSIYDTKPIIGGGKSYDKIDKNKIRKFIEYVENKGVIKNNTRIQAYNNIQLKNMITNMFLPTKFNIMDIKIDSQLIDSKFLRHEISMRMFEKLNEIIKKKFGNGSAIKTYKEIGQIIHDDELVDIFNSILVEQYDIYAIKNSDHTNNFQYAETLHTFLEVLHDMNTDFRRLIHDYYIKIKITNDIFTLTDINKRVKLQDIFKGLITDVLKKIISDTRNIYQELIYKNKLLTLSLY